MAGLVKELIHFSAESLQFDSKRKYKQPKDGMGPGFGKPYGLWLSDETDNGWKDWCEGAGYALEALHHKKTFVCDLSNWLVLGNVQAILDFTRKYDHPAYPDSKHLRLIRWNLVAKEYAGVLISPYCYQLRMHPETTWYYGWDCASGCVWDLSTVKEVVVEPSC